MSLKKKLENKTQKSKLEILRKKQKEKLKKFKKQKYLNITQSIQSQILNNNLYKDQAYKRLAYIVDTFGPRKWGSVNLELAIDFLEQEMKKENFENVRKEKINGIQNWVRGNEVLTLYSPRPIPSQLNVIGLGLTVSGDVTGQIIVIKDFQDLEQKKDQVSGKIVLMNFKYHNYSEGSLYRVEGPSKVAKLGAIAFLIKSVTPYSIGSIHTGYVKYEKGFEIPAAAISIEDAEMFQRMQNRGQKIVVNLLLEGHYSENRTSYNLIGDIKGSKYPEQILMMGGHLDSWDTGSQTGAIDDGAGVMVCFEALRVLIKLGLRPKRTIRFIAWSGEEMDKDNQGALINIKNFENDIEQLLLVFESDEGNTMLKGFGFSGNNSSQKIFQKVMEKYIEHLGFSIQEKSGESVDNGYYKEKYDVALLKNLVLDNQQKDFYFTFHHSAGDSMSIINPNELNQNVIGIASIIYNK